MLIGYARVSRVKVRIRDILGNSGYSHAYLAPRLGILPYLTSFCELFK
jgi:hypothetical protein